jgi:SAM-dependent methyltransferase
VTMDAQYWDDRYGHSDQLFSGNPNGVLVTEVADLPAGRALDVGCGEGGDAHWLTAVDISRVALDRAAAADPGGRVTWVRADVSVEPPPAGPFDLVSVHYIPLPHQPDHAALRALLGTLAPGGTFLFVFHDLAELPSKEELGVDPADFYQPDEIAKLLDDTWTVEVDETRPRTAPAPPGSHHTRDVVLRVRRTLTS